MDSQTPSVHSITSQSEYSWVSNTNSISSDNDDISSSDISSNYDQHNLMNTDNNNPDTTGIILDTNENELFSNNSIDRSNNPAGDPMIDVSKFISQSLLQTIGSTDFSKALQLQAKTSAHLNSKTLELQHLINESQERLLTLQNKLKLSQNLSNNIRNNLSKSNKIIQNFNNSLMIDYPIEFNNAKDQILERQQDID